MPRSTNNSKTGKAVKPRVPAHILSDLEKALEYAQMKHANFGDMKVSFHDFGGDGPEAQKLDRFIKEETNSYRETWLIPRIQRVLDWAKGDEVQKW